MPKKQDIVEGTLTINYWWKCDQFKKQIPTDLKTNVEILEHIGHKLEKGWKSGQISLCCFADVPGKKTPSDGWQITGYWDSSESIQGELVLALEEMLKAYAPDADKTVEKEGEQALHSAVRMARAALKRAKE